jgi:tetratricopeptide (TPR) repeat protein
MRRAAGFIAAGCLALAAQAAVDIDALWDYRQPAVSEERFRAALASAEGDEALALRTQIARTFSLRARYAEAHAELDAIETALGGANAEVKVRWRLEKGRTLRSSGQPALARPLFAEAFRIADAARLEALAADALHMQALAHDKLDERIEWNRRTIDYAQRASHPRARAWRAAALNNIGSDLRAAGRLDDSLMAFREALAAYEGIGRPRGIHIARWQVANVLRLKGDLDAALEIQVDLDRESARAGERDAHVCDELALLHEARGDAEQAAAFRACAAAARSK